MKIFVAGGTGVLGRRLVPLLVADHDVTVNVRNDSARRSVDELGATATTVDVFDARAVRQAVAGHDAIINVATAIPSSARSARKKSWATNDRLRTDATRNLADAAGADGLLSMPLQISAAVAGKRRDRGQGRRIVSECGKVCSRCDGTGLRQCRRHGRKR